MQQLALLMIVGVTIVPYLSVGDAFGRFAILPGPAKYIPEILGGVALLFVIALGIRDRFRFVRPAYWVIFGLLTICVAASAVANSLEPGPLFSGIRAYLRAIPWFLVPAVFAFGENNVRTQLKWLLGISLLQVPIAIEQRITTGDNYYGFVRGNRRLDDRNAHVLGPSFDLSRFRRVCRRGTDAQGSVAEVARALVGDGVARADDDQRNESHFDHAAARAVRDVSGCSRSAAND